MALDFGIFYEIEIPKPWRLYRSVETLSGSGKKTIFADTR